MEDFSAGDTAFILISAAMVLLMTPGLAFFYGGMTRAKSVLNMMMMSFIALATVPVVWVLWGYSMAFGGEGAFIGGFDLVGMSGMTADSFDQGLDHPGLRLLRVPDDVRHHHRGPDQRRDRRPGEVRHLGPVHRPVGDAGLLPGGPQRVGRRLDPRDARPNRLRRWYRGSHQRRCCGAGLGASSSASASASRRTRCVRTTCRSSCWARPLLWFGWFGFNAGSELAADGVASVMLLNTTVATAAAILGWLVVELVRDKAATTLGAASGAIAGLVAITPSGANVSPLGAIALGAVAGIVCALAVGLKYKLGYDDSLDVVGVHLVGGLVGSILVGLLAVGDLRWHRRQRRPAGAPDCCRADRAGLLVHRHLHPGNPARQDHRVPYQGGGRDRRHRHDHARGDRLRVLHQRWLACQERPRVCVRAS